MTSTNEELKNQEEELESQNEYLRKQLGSKMKQKQKVLESPPGSIHGDKKQVTWLVRQVKQNL